MESALQQAASRQSIDGYGGGGFTVSGNRYEGNLLVTLNACAPVNIASFAALSADDVAQIIAAHPEIEVLLVGSGERIELLKPDIRQSLRACGVAVDVLDSGAACRTFNVLASEERRVAALLFAV